MSSTLQTELKQLRPFPRRTTEAMLSILRTAAVLDHHLDVALRPHRLTSTQYNVLRILRGAGSEGLCGRDVADRMLARVPDVPRLLERLEGTGLIARERDAADRRQVTARITRKGLHLLEQVTPDVDAVEHARLGHLSGPALAGLIRGLTAIRQGR
jgi:DNA-binding MarR family transcriptional regulator